jgi:hypothetical protein
MHNILYGEYIDDRVWQNFYPTKISIYTAKFHHIQTISLQCQAEFGANGVNIITPHAHAQQEVK